MLLFSGAKIRDSCVRGDHAIHSDTEVGPHCVHFFALFHSYIFLQETLNFIFDMLHVLRLGYTIPQNHTSRPRHPPPDFRDLGNFREIL